MTTNAVAHSADRIVGKVFRTQPFVALSIVVAVCFAFPTQGRAAGQTAVNPDAFLQAVAEVETGGNTRAIGRRGERGLYQFTRATWQRYSKRAFGEAHNPAIAREVALRHFDWLSARIAAEGGQPTAYRLAVAWNAGIGRALSGSAPRSTRDYARRVSNLAGLYRPATKALRSDPAMVAAAVSSELPPPVFSLAQTQTTSSVQLDFTLPDSAPEVELSDFSLDERDLMPGDSLVTESAADSAQAEVTFSLASSPSKPPASSRRLIFATIGE